MHTDRRESLAGYLAKGGFRGLGAVLGVIGGAIILWWLLRAASHLLVRVLAGLDVPHDPGALTTVVASPVVFLLCILAHVLDAVWGLQRGPAPDARS